MGFLRSAALTITHCTQECIKVSTMDSRCVPCAELLNGPDPPGSCPAAAPAPTGRRREAPRELPQVCARNPRTRLRAARAIALETTARARARGEGARIG